MSHDERLPRSYLVQFVLMMAVVIFFGSVGLHTIFVEGDELIEANKEPVDCNKIYENPENFRPIDGTVYEKIEYCDRWNTELRPLVEPAVNNAKVAVFIIPFFIAGSIYFSRWIA